MNPQEQKSIRRRENCVAVVLVFAFIILLVLSVGLATVTPFTYGKF